MEFEGWVALAARVMEGAGVLAMLVGAVVALVVAATRFTRDRAGAYRALREYFGRSILLGLEFLVAADIIRTVSQIPTLEKVLVLAFIVAIRTFLSFTLNLEIEGRWPWQQRRRTPVERPISREEPVEAAPH